MPSDLFSIGASGVRAARAQLDMTAQNIANANTKGYVRRTLSQAELVSATSTQQFSQNILAGVRINGTKRGGADFQASEMRRNASDASRSKAELEALRPIEAGIEKSKVYESIVGFEASLKQLTTDPNDPALRAAVIGKAGQMADSLNIAAKQLKAHGEGLRFNAETDVKAVNQAAEELAKVNASLSQMRPGSAAHANLLDERDRHLATISEKVGIQTTFDAHGAAKVTLAGDSSGKSLVDGTTTKPLAASAAADGTISFTLDGAAATPSSGSLIGQQNALVETRDALGKLDALAVKISGLVNSAQTGGVDRNGAAGAALFTGTGAADLKLATRDGAKIVTAPAGAAAGSRDASALEGLRNALSDGKVAETANGLLFDVSSRIKSQEVTKNALQSIADSSRAAFERSAGVNLDEEAANLVRYQQAFQASGRVMQVASDLFDSILNLR